MPEFVNEINSMNMIRCRILIAANSNIYEFFTRGKFLDLGRCWTKSEENWGGEGVSVMGVIGRFMQGF